MVGTSSCVPNTASVKEICRSKATLIPSRCNSLCGSSSISIIRSPGAPPLSPALPFPLRFNCMPSCTPAGISIEIASSPYTLPSPLHAGHLAVIVDPSPLQVGHVVTVCIWPMNVLVTLLTCPDPPQVPQVCTLPLSFAPLPLQVLQTTCFFTLIFFVTPLAISS